LVLEKSGENSKTLNIKKFALSLLVDLARIYGLSSGSEKAETMARFEHAYENNLLSEDMLKNVQGAFQFITQVRLSHQFTALKEGRVADNHIDPNAFGSFERKHLKDAFRIIADLQEYTKLKFNRQ